ADPISPGGDGTTAMLSCCLPDKRQECNSACGRIVGDDLSVERRSVYDRGRQPRIPNYERLRSGNDRLLSGQRGRRRAQACRSEAAFWRFAFGECEVRDLLRWQGLEF